MDEELRGQVSEAILDILRSADLTVMTTATVRATVSKHFNIDPSLPDLKIFVKSVVDSFLKSKQGEEEGSNQAEEEEEQENTSHKDEYTANGDLIIYRLTKKRLITLQPYNGTTLVSIREYFTRNGQELPTSKGISLPIDQWKDLKNAIPAIERGIEKLEY
ncbi:RNA polymerase II transcriptional coactivator KELP-like [Dioscorea cayenensis subsp. rotundata]|uniref:RNA polymerase II transcriptional coactivator KELP-like n=1 Tax=Dioscorea cayennensis subsp. rotundata TaxID=55577 RepID=A0AB40CG66_DIOCR|nr:RNA polymerase II transcriptional coactivator KELP-like [Dioscorea cayenensis subsp. rotundata]